MRFATHHDQSELTAQIAVIYSINTLEHPLKKINLSNRLLKKSLLFVHANWFDNLRTPLIYSLRFKRSGLGWIVFSERLSGG